jgi:hypothetical protein
MYVDVGDSEAATTRWWVSRIIVEKTAPGKADKQSGKANRDNHASKIGHFDHQGLPLRAVFFKYSYPLIMVMTGNTKIRGRCSGLVHTMMPMQMTSTSKRSRIMDLHGQTTRPKIKTSVIIR